ncbi:ROK family protein [Aliigemmobacter aestuarii]|uniref:ROK family protein n=1 Tax=Aliigemmobacter aestuarii TaxID=1445661 RepID=A0A4S3MUB4_9RHOB|nr:ROK family protein [Gemmobacter aestuarii]THD85763.1 ROK family protein [Gemmobacter aestuarii]
MIGVFDIGGSRVKAAVSARTGALEPLGAVDTPGASFPAFAQALRSLLPPGAERVAVSIAGCVDPDSGVMRCANIPCVDGIMLADDLQRALDLPVTVVNDADAFALAEAGSGAGAGHRTVFGVILGTGVGGGLVIDGRLVTGPGGFAGEWGHGPVMNRHVRGHDLPVFACGCGLDGCLDPVGGARGLERLHETLHNRARPSRGIEDDWQAGDPEATETVAVWADLLAAPLAMIVNTVGATVVPVGGGLGKSEALVATLDAAVRGLTLYRHKAPLLVQAHHRVEPGLIGAAHAGWQAHG